LFFEPGNIADIERKLRKGLLLKNWKERVEKNHRFAIDKFSLSKAVKNYESFYESVLS
jgi:hypothetical protein